ncbi:MAG: DNA mismatch repair protein MutL [Chloroflexi bacterium HGW-Chloroflexi-4]|jgi:DNA mismatch repair protein MutL|nr:MAG: DNA mismatch repair protein MutL [Chloroflexi bacterium HGW-Chloroflexi-4]
MPIKILPDEVASQIAAGEVVERASSVVKELLENAIDAKATRISIRVMDAGKRLIEVSDDGKGINKGELELAVTRHATSKLDSAEDLFHIRTLGFRGEALASMGSVSRMTMTSHNSQETSGSRIVIEGGKIASIETTGVPIGTVVSVNDLFYNTPARLKFLKSDQTERQQIETLVTRYALAYPHLAIQLEMDGKQTFRSTGNGDRREILAQLYGFEIAKGLLEVVFDDEGVKITGFISPISVTRSNRKEITIFVNGRWIQDIGLATALVRAYQTYLMVGRYPISLLNIELEPEEVDVNVHPAKAEVRFKQPDVLFAMVQRAVKRALLAYSPVPQMNPAHWQTNTFNHQPEPAWINARLNWEETKQAEIDPVTGDPDVTIEKLEHPANNPEPSRIPLLRLIGQIGATYLVAEGPDGMYLIDQHAAHERVLFEKMSHHTQEISSQALLHPEVVQFSPQSSRVISESLEILNQHGFVVDEFGLNTYRISAIPTLFSNGNAQSALRCIVEDFEEDETPLQGLLADKLIARICKRMAVKGGQPLSVQEQSALLSDLEKCDSPRTCPHGRPTMIHLSVDLLERQFGRRGARSM